MRPSFYPRLINGPFDDPGIYVPFIFTNRALLFDLGDLAPLSARDILKVSHVFVTHTHMDHFVGFDRILRLFLGREKELHLFGPQGFMANVEGKLAGYTWNLVQSYDNRFCLSVTEVGADTLYTQKYLCREQFAKGGKPQKRPFKGCLHNELTLKVDATILDHGIDSLGFSLKERFHVNIKKDGLLRLGLTTGPWINHFKKALFDNKDPQFEISVPTPKPRNFLLKELADQIAVITPGQKITYIADAAYCQKNIDKMVDLAQDTDHLFIEAPFLDKHTDTARLKKHLTAAQAGTIAGRAQAKRFTPFHFSPRYSDQPDLLEQEAQNAYRQALS
jgi:ribonuclease Z